MKRVSIFEFEDLSWFPNALRKPMTRYVAAVHRVMGTSESIADLLQQVIQKTGKKQVIDLCSGSGGPLPQVQEILKEKHGLSDVRIRMSDLYPNLETAAALNKEASSISYLTTPLNATDVPKEQDGIRTMICSLHHMEPPIAQAILRNAKESNQPFLAFEISDNSIPLFIAWIAIPIGFLMTLLITPFVRPMTWQQIVFTYIIPILPIFIAWDGGVSNMRTYTLEDMDILTQNLSDEDYQWEKGSIKGKGGNQLYLMGIPKKK